MQQNSEFVKEPSAETRAALAEVAALAERRAEEDAAEDADEDDAAWQRAAEAMVALQRARQVSSTGSVVPAGSW